MATGESYHSLAFHLRMDVSTISEIVKETSRVIWERLSEKYMPFPTGADPDIRQIRTGECQILWPKNYPL